MTFYFALSHSSFLLTFLFIARGYAGSRQLTTFLPIASLLMTEMSLYSLSQVRSFYVKFFGSTPMLPIHHSLISPLHNTWLSVLNR